MTISKRLLMLVLASVVSLLVVSGLNMVQTDRVYEKANFGNVNVVPSILLLDQAVVEFGRMRVRTYRHVLSTDAKAMADMDAKILEAKAAVEKTLKDYEPMVIDAEDKRFLEAEKAALAIYAQMNEKILAASRQNRQEEAMKLVMDITKPAQDLTQALEDHMAFNRDLGLKTTADALSAKRMTVWLSTAISLAAIALVAAIGLSMRSNITSHLQGANQLAERIAAGDLTVFGQQTYSSDEIGQLMTAMEKMRSELSSTVGSVVRNAQELSSSASQLSTAAQQVSISTESQSSSTSSAAAAVEELTVSIDTVGSSADDARLQAQDAGTMAEASGKGVGDATNQIIQVAASVEDTSTQIQALAEQVQLIGNITTVIRDVADQTNLLALNAAIEAARAGDTGRGFAVVADEVRKLAERTTSSVQEISAVIGTIQHGAEAAVSSMENSRKVVSDVVASAKAASDSMQGIQGATETVQYAITGISEALKEQRGASTELARNVETIAQMSEENSAAVASVADTANRLVVVSDSLKASVARFRL